MIRSRLALTASLALLALAACGSDTSDDGADGTPSATQAPTPTAKGAGGSFPVTVETCGRDVTFAEAPDAVVTGWPTTIETLDALGVGDAVIGYTSSDLASAPDTDAEAIAPDFRTSREVMLATGLDMFLVNDENQIDASEGNLGWSDLKTASAGAYVLGGYCLDAPAPTELDVIYDDVTNLGAIFGVADRAAELNVELAERVQAAADRVEPLHGASVAVVQVYDGTLYALSGSTYTMIPAALGMENAFADLDANFAEISPEEVLTMAPDVVVIVHEGGADAAAADVAQITTMLASAPAIANGKIATVESGVLSGGGVNVIEVIENVGEQLT